MSIYCFHLGGVNRTRIIAGCGTLRCANVDLCHLCVHGMHVALVWLQGVHFAMANILYHNANIKSPEQQMRLGNEVPVKALEKILTSVTK